jgi:pyridoxine 5-phosphate synthase
MKLGVNIDHVATVRQARMVKEPEPVLAAQLVELAGADSIVCHLREDRRHLQDRDLRILREIITTRLNLEMALSDEIAKIALEIKPDQVTFVPEKRQEITTEGGLDIIKERKRVEEFTKRFKDAGITVSLFIDANANQLQIAKAVGADMVELHTGEYANAKTDKDQHAAYNKISEGAIVSKSMRLIVAAGHGLNYQNVQPIAHIKEIEELNIGHSIISRAIFTGIEKAVREMKELIQR